MDDLLSVKYIPLLTPPHLTPKPLAVKSDEPDICCSECGRRVDGTRRKSDEMIPKDTVTSFIDCMENGESGPSADLAKVAG